MASGYGISPIGTVRKQGADTHIVIVEAYKEGLAGLEQFSHIVVLYWFHKNDTPEGRMTLRVHPRRDPANPLTGVFATRSPARPNPIGITICELLSVEGNTLCVDTLDAFDGTPVIDIKPCITRLDLVSRIRVPEWAAAVEREEGDPEWSAEPHGQQTEASREDG